ncbi:leucine-rich repeat-containing protein 37B-like isoform X2 [Accipiter gentilis]|uniref:leucine-rich repeat-containing protein 37B-like isoform X2 n=1 Tax=Astur gentilis TaxID=8957 RepID=UPI002110B05A|nr:leucine-rich repeat-containing protein 37B-like isoform X2 [Accipiter gentilis]
MAETPEAPDPAPSREARGHSGEACARPQACGHPLPRCPATPRRACSAMGLSRPGRPLLLLALLMAAAPKPGRHGGSCPLPCRCRRRLLDCSHAALGGVPSTARRWALSILDFTGNSISSIEKQAWREYPWAEYLVLQDNDLRAVKRRSLEGLVLLEHLDLSCNKILSIEEHAFEPLPFLQLINLGGNLITQIQNGTFQAWHGMQFLQKLILSHNPLSVITDTSFFKLPSVKYLDLGATQVTQQTLLMLLLRTVRLETLWTPRRGLRSWVFLQ